MQAIFLSKKAVFPESTNTRIGMGSMSEPVLLFCHFFSFGSTFSHIFALSFLEGKIMNLADETPRFTINATERFKKITGSVIQPIIEKSKPPRLDAPPF
jgi:hypothetical protein